MKNKQMKPDPYKLRVFVRDPEEWEPVLAMLAEIQHCDEQREELHDDTVFWADDDDSIDAKLVLAYDGIQHEMTLEEPSIDRIPKTRTLFITRSNDDALRLWAFRHGADDVLIFPFTHPDLEMRIQRLVFSNRNYFLRQVPRDDALGFLKAQIEAGVKEIRPALDPFAAIGHFYPTVASYFGRSIGGHELLDRLTEENLLEGQIVNRVRVCPLCSDLHLNYRETCPRCKSLNFLREDTLHHFPCGHVNSIDEFRSDGGDLICPKCSKKLRHIGLDYERLSQNLKCQDCKHVFAEAQVDVQCLWCGWVGEPDDTLERRVFNYVITDKAVDLARNGAALTTQDTSAIGHNAPGLYSREYFRFELQRELRRYSQLPDYEFCLMMIKVVDFDHIRNEHEAESENYLVDLFKALRQPMSELAVGCALERDTLGVILPGYSLQQARELAAEIDRSVQSLTHLLPIHEPEIAGTVVSCTENFENAKEMLSKAAQELDK